MSLPEVGDEILGKYRINKRLGEGGMGVVYAATHIELQETVAIKMLSPNLMRRDEVVARFMREARAAAKIKNDHAVRVLDVGKLDGGVPYMVMEFLDGQDLEQLLESRGPLPLREVIGYLVQTAEALGEAHRQGIVHRDIKPANLFLAKKSNGKRVVKVLDFGISKVQNENLTGGEATRTEAVMGTPMYMSPEQLRSTRNVDARADVWSLGIVFYRLLTGGFPFEGESIPVICSEVLAARYKPIRSRRPDLPVEIEPIVAQCLEKDRDKRFASVEGFVQALIPFGDADGAGLAPIVLDSTGNSGGNWAPPGTGGASSITGSSKPANALPLIVISAFAVLIVGAIGIFAWKRTSNEAVPAPEKSAEIKPATTSASSIVSVGQAMPLNDSQPPPATTQSTAPTATPTAKPATSTVGTSTIGTSTTTGTSTAKVPTTKPTSNNKVFDVGGRK